MRKNYLAACLAFLCTAPLMAEEKKEDIVEMTHQFESDHLWKSGVGIGTGHTTDLVIFSLESPALWSLRIGNYVTFHDIFVELQSLTVRNILVDKDTAKLKDASSAAINFGFLGRTYFSDDFAIYGKFGANYLDLDRRLASKAVPHWGGILGLGAERLWAVPHTRWNWFNAKKGAVFVEATYNWNEFEADKIAGSPSLFNHVFISLGFRTFY